MGFHGRYAKSGPVKHRARFVKGELPQWIDSPGTLMRASAKLIRVNGESQIPGYLTVRPLGKWESSPIVLCKAGDFGLYLGKKHVRQKMASGRELSVPVPTFFFNGHRIVFTTLLSYDDAVIADVVYEDWLAQHPG